jgi:hypothetical protein
MQAAATCAATVDVLCRLLSCYIEQLRQPDDLIQSRTGSYHNDPCVLTQITAADLCDDLTAGVTGIDCGYILDQGDFKKAPGSFKCPVCNSPKSRCANCTHACS